MGPVTTRFSFKLKFTVSKTSNSTEFSSQCLPETPGNLLKIRRADLLDILVVGCCRWWGRTHVNVKRSAMSPKWLTVRCCGCWCTRSDAMLHAESVVATRFCTARDVGYINLFTQLQ